MRMKKKTYVKPLTEVFECVTVVPRPRWHILTVSDLDRAPGRGFLTAKRPRIHPFMNN